MIKRGVFAVICGWLGLGSLIYGVSWSLKNLGYMETHYLVFGILVTVMFFTFGALCWPERKK